MGNKITEVLYISMFAPYDTVPHAGGKVHNFYVKELQKRKNVHQTLISMCYEPEVKLLDLKQYGIDHDLVILDKTKFHKNLRKFISSFSYFNPWDKYCNTLLNYERYKLKSKIRKYKRWHKEPDVVILQWTQIIFLMPFIKELFPDAKIVAIEEDVLFLNYLRRIELQEQLLKKKMASYRYEKIKALELECLKQADLVVTNNYKDTNLLIANGIHKEAIYTSTVYVANYFNVNNRPSGKDILFYGAMYRQENYLSVKWFVDNVFNKLDDPEIHLYIVGGKPPKEIEALQCVRIIVTGFVDNVAEYFEKCMCMVAPLVLGAGIKVKVLEAMSSGIPVLTNEIGIEGIKAIPDKHYYHCVEPEDYIAMIQKIANKECDTSQMKEESKKFIRDNYGMADKVNGLYDRLFAESLQ